MADLVTNASDVELIIGDATENGTITNTTRLKVDEFTISTETEIGSVPQLGRNTPKGLTRGSVEYTFDFSTNGYESDIAERISDSEGVPQPFAIRAEKPDSDGSGTEWQYKLLPCLAEAEEITATTGESVGMSVEGYAGTLDEPGN